MYTAPCPVALDLGSICHVRYAGKKYNPEVEAYIWYICIGIPILCVYRYTTYIHMYIYIYMYI